MLLLYVFSFILGRSSDLSESSFSDGKETNNESEQPAWGGRLEHLKQDLFKAVLESEYRTRASHAAMEDRISRLENDMKDIKNMLAIIMQSTMDNKKTARDDNNHSNLKEDWRTELNLTWVVYHIVHVP